MGFVRKPLVLTWPADHELHGLNVTMRRMSIGQLRALADRPAPGDDQAAEEFMNFMIDSVAAGLVAWNLEEEYQETPDAPVTRAPVPATRDAVWNQDKPLALAILDNWLDTAAGVSESSPLDPSSNSGDISAVASLTMEPLSPSLLS